jgi:two-component system, NarL family, sensor histidine kinase UhpB
MDTSLARILIVEDNSGDYALARRMIESMKSRRFVPIHAGTLAEAIEMLAEPVDLMLLDLNLPDSQDLDTLRHLRSVAPQLPIVILTGIEDRQKAVEALSEGAQDYLVKGKVDHHLLERAICRHLGIEDAQITASPS